MPFKPNRLTDRILAGREAEQQQVNAPPMFSAAGAAQQAKTASAQWQRSGIDNPRRDSAPAWFVGQQRFTELRRANEGSFNDWGDRFRNTTAMGFDFQPPPPEPEPAPAAKETA